MRHLRLLATASLATSALFAGTASAAPPTASNVPAPFADCSYVRGVTTDDAHTNQTGQGHTLHGNGWGYGHGCGDGGGDTGGGTGGGTIGDV